MSQIKEEFGDIVNRELIFTATILDPLWNETTNSSFLVSFYEKQYKIKFLNKISGVFKPQMVYSTDVKNKHFSLRNDHRSAFFLRSWFST